MEKPTEIADLPDIELLELLCSSDDDEAAYKHFVNRFHKDVQEQCNKICSNRKLDAHIGKEIANVVFERVRKYKSFKKDGIKVTNNRKAIIVYLNKIAVSLFNDHYKKEQRQIVPHKTYFDDLSHTAVSIHDVKALKNKADVAKLIFSKLNEKERIVLLTDLDYKRHHKYLPDAVIEGLAIQLDVKPATIRKLRQRAIDKINTALNEINQN